MRKAISTLAVLMGTAIALQGEPENFDWRTRSYVVSDVRTQPSGKVSAYAYAITAALEAQYGIKYNNGAKLSVQ
jgi:hypothetical protein